MAIQLQTSEAEGTAHYVMLLRLFFSFYKTQRMSGLTGICIDKDNDGCPEITPSILQVIVPFGAAAQREVCEGLCGYYLHHYHHYHPMILALLPF